MQQKYVEGGERVTFGAGGRFVIRAATAGGERETGNEGRRAASLCKEQHASLNCPPPYNPYDL